MNKIINNQLIKAFALCFGFFSFAACNEDSVIKPNLIPPVDNIHTFAMSIDSFGVTLQPGYFDSVRTDDNSNSIVALGSIADPFFGRTTAGFYFQITPPTGDFVFPTDITSIDSVVLAVPYYDVSYGDTTSTNQQKINVYRITQNDFFYINGTDTNRYYSFDQLSTDPLPIASATVSFASIQAKVVYPSGDTVGNTLRIKLNDNTLATEFKNLDTSILGSYENFMNYFRGLYVMPDTTASPDYQKRISYFSLGSLTNSSLNKARLEIYYTQSDGTLKSISFPYTQGASAFFSRLIRNYQSSPAATFTQNSVHDSVVIQTYPGLYTDITIQDIQKIHPECIINKAQLTLTLLKVGNDDLYLPPSYLIPKGVNEDGTLYTIEDYFDNSGYATSPTIGGGIEIDSATGQQYIKYHINIPRELQKAIISGKNALTLRLAAQYSYLGAYRLVAAGVNGDENTRLKFDVVYTKQNP